MELEHLIQDFINNEDVFIPTLIAVAVTFGVTIGTIGKTVRGIARERTKREIAAYIAEGSMTPEQGERLMKAGDKLGCG